MSNTLEEDITSRIINQYQHNIDFEILADVLTGIGWSKVFLPNDLHLPDDINNFNKWIKQNIRGHYKFKDDLWLFEREKDATIFALRWT